MAKIDIIRAHEHSAQHRDELLASVTCGCFHCRRMFPPDEIEDWVDELEGVGQTALCPNCGIDSVIGSASGYSITTDLLENMRRHWFGST